MFKNTAGQKVAFFAFDVTTGEPVTGDAANIDAFVNKDWAGQAALTDTSATEIDDTEDPGSYLFDLTQGETDADVLRFSAISSTANVVLVAFTVFTVDPVVASNVAAIKADTDNLPSDPADASDIAAAFAAVPAAVRDVSLGSAVAAPGVAPTLGEALFAMHQRKFSATIAGTTLTVFDVDGTTPLLTCEIDDPANVTEIFRDT